jgi:hypothetical protein
VRDVGDRDDEPEALALALAEHGVVEVLRGLAVDGHEWQAGEVDARVALGRQYVIGQLLRLRERGLGERERQRVLAQRDLDLHARVGCTPEDFDDTCDWLALAGRVLTTSTTTTSPASRRRDRRGHDQVLRDAPVLGDDEPHAAPVVASDDPVLRAVEHPTISPGTSPAPVDAVDAARSRGRRGMPCASRARAARRRVRVVADRWKP